MTGPQIVEMLHTDAEIGLSLNLSPRGLFLLSAEIRRLENERAQLAADLAEVAPHRLPLHLQELPK